MTLNKFIKLIEPQDLEFFDQKASDLGNSGWFIFEEG